MNFIPDESANKAGIFRFKTVLFNIDFRYNRSNYDKKKTLRGIVRSFDEMGTVDWL